MQVSGSREVPIAPEHIGARTSRGVSKPGLHATFAVKSAPHSAEDLQVTTTHPQVTTTDLHETAANLTATAVDPHVAANEKAIGAGADPATDSSGTTPVAPSARRTRQKGQVAMPVRALSAAVTFGAIASMSITTAQDPDVFWHVRTGQWIWAHQRVPKVDPFSWTAPGRKWIAHEWLTEAIYASLHSAFGWVGIAVLSALIITTGWMFVRATCMRLGAGPLASSSATLLAAIASLHTWGTRPQMISLMFVAITAYLLADANAPSDESTPPTGKRLFLVVPMMLLWANLHGGYIFGIAMLCAYMVAIAGEFAIRRVVGVSRVVAWRTAVGPTPALARNAVLATIAATAATLINPNGLEGFTYPFSYLGENASTKYVIEWFAPDFSKAQYWPFAVVAALFAAALVKRIRTIPPHLLTIGLPFAFLAFQSVRNITQFVIIAAPLLALLFSKAAAKQRPAHPDDRKITAIVGAMMGVAVIVLSTSTLTASANAKVQAKEFPVEATKALAELATTSDVRMFNQYDWGGYIMLAAPELKVFVDGRPDMYGDEFVDRYMSTWWLKAGWKERLAEDGVNTVIANPKSDMIRALRKDTAWTSVYDDSVAVILQRR